MQQLADDVVHHVLYDNYLQVQILSQETMVSVRRMEGYEDLMLEFERHHLLDRRLEFLPSASAWPDRAAAGQGMARPELCVLLAYAKRLLRDQILASELPDDPYLQTTLARVFPALDRRALRGVRPDGTPRPFHDQAREILRQGGLKVRIIGQLRARI